MKKRLMCSMALTGLIGVVSADASIWSENFDGLATGTGDLVVNGNPVFGSAAPDVATNQWAVGHTKWSIRDSGGGDHVLRMLDNNSSHGAAVWLDVSELGLAAGTYSMQFTVSGYTLSGSGTVPNQFANVLKAKGVDATTADTVTWDLAKGANFDNTVSAGGATIATDGSYVTSISPRTGATFFSADGTVTHTFTVAADDEYIGLIIANNDLNGQTAAFDVDDISITRAPWPGDFDTLAVGTGDLVVNSAPVFGSASPDVSIEQWAVGSTDFSVVDSGGGDHVLSLAHSGSSLGAAIWLDVGLLGLSAGEHRMQFTVSGYALTGSGTAPKPFSNVVRAKGVDASTADTVTWSLSRGANFNDVATAGSALVTTDGAYGTSATVHNPAGGATLFTTNGVVTHSFAIAADDEYIGLIIGNNDQNGQTASFSIDDVSVVASTTLIEPQIAASSLVIADGETVDLDITFDSSADFAELTDSLGSPATDLKALDGDNDGEVALTGLTPAATLTYTVTTTNATDSKVAETVVGVFSEPDDNAFTMAVLNDNPEFFYRFEEPTDSLFLYDSSGNGHHTVSILGEAGLTQGVAGQSGLGARMDGSVRIQSPATNNWNQDFSVAVVVSVDNGLAGQGFLSKDRNDVGAGGIQGRGVLGIREDPVALQSNIGDGTSVWDTSGNTLASNVLYLVHMTYDDSANEISYYVNGSLWSTVSKTVTNNHTGPWNIAGGANQGKTTGHLDGVMDEAALFVKTLSPAEITAHYSAFLSGSDQNYALWLASEYPGFTNQTGKADNPDGDALDNWNEYAFGGDPTVADTGLPGSLHVGAGYIEFVHVMRKNADDLDYYLETDTDLVAAPGWTNAFYTVTGTNDGYSAAFAQVTNQVPTDVPVRFIRAQAVEK